VADLEQLAVKRDRGYLVRLIAMLLAGVAVSAGLWQALTGGGVSGCAARAFLGQPGAPATDPANPAPAAR
jgi:hypothetical protein